MTMTMFKPTIGAWLAARPSQPPAVSVIADELPALDALLTALPDRIDYPLLLVDTDGWLMLANRSGRRMLGPGGALRLEAGRVQAHDAVRQRSLLNALRAAAQGRRSLLSMANGVSGAAMLAVTPLDSVLIPERAVLLMGGRSQACEPLSLDFFVRAHGITQAEAGVLRALCEGQAPADIARNSGVAVCTVRTQVASLRQKTATRNVGDLVRLVSMLPPIMGLLS